MFEKFNFKDYRLIVFCIIISIVSLVIVQKYFMRVFPEASIRMEITKDEAHMKAKQFLANRGKDVSEYMHAHRFGWLDEAKEFVEFELSPDEYEGFAPDIGPWETSQMFTPDPVLLAVEDVPSDQGGRVYIDFQRSFYDRGSLNNRTEGYQIERMDVDDWVGVGTYNAYGDSSYTIEVTTLTETISKREIDILDLPSIFQISLAQETQQETIEQLIVELKATNDRVEQLSKIAYEQSKLLESLYKKVETYENSRDRLRETT